MKRGSFIHYFFSEVCPPFIRDNRQLMSFLAKRTGNPQVVDYTRDFREKLPYMNNDEIKEYYTKLSMLTPNLEQELDVKADCLEYILDYAILHPEKTRWLDCACGGGGVKKMLANLGKKVTGVDFFISDSLKSNIVENASFIECNILQLPFEDNSFDIVLSAHTLEHIVQIQSAISELRRVAKETLIIIVPKQREYKYTFETHVHFFPYAESFHRIMENPAAKCFYLDNDILYIEELYPVNRIEDK